MTSTATQPVACPSTANPSGSVGSAPTTLDASNPSSRIERSSASTLPTEDAST